MAKKPKTKPPAKMGRPTTYKPEYCEEIIKYFSIEPYSLVEREIIKDGQSVAIQVREASDFPNFAGFACQIDTHRAVLHDWCEKHPDFADAYKKAKELQEKWLVTNAMKMNMVSTPFAIFTAKNVIGWRDQKEVKATVDQTVKQESSPEDKKQLDLLAEFLKTKLSDRKA